MAGLTLGGGLGYLTRRFGWTVDTLLEVEIVTADGRVRRASREESSDLFWAQPYTQVQSYLDVGEPKGHHYYWKTEYLSELSDGLCSTWRELAAECPIPEAQLGILHLGGALNDHDEDDGVVGNRDAKFAVGVIGTWEPDEPNTESFPQWVRDAWQQIRPFSTGGNYINFKTADEDSKRIRATYGMNYDRLVEIKKTYDPSNLFRSNRNIAPPALDT